MFASYLNAFQPMRDVAKYTAGSPRRPPPVSGSSICSIPRPTCSTFRGAGRPSGPRAVRFEDVTADDGNETAAFEHVDFRPPGPASWRRPGRPAQPSPRWFHYSFACETRRDDPKLLLEYERSDGSTVAGHWYACLYAFRPRQAELAADLIRRSPADSLVAMTS